MSLEFVIAIFDPRRALAAACFVFLGVTVAACDPTPAEEPLAVRIARAEALAPSDPRLAEIYGRTCRVCHIQPDSGAPLAGDAAAWNARFAKGDEALHSHARDGFNAMPPRGQCYDCTDDDLTQLTLFMAGRAGSGETTP